MCSFLKKLIYFCFTTLQRASFRDEHLKNKVGRDYNYKDTIEMSSSRLWISEGVFRIYGQWKWGMVTA